MHTLLCMHMHRVHPVSKNTYNGMYIGITRYVHTIVDVTVILYIYTQVASVARSTPVTVM